MIRSIACLSMGIAALAIVSPVNAAEGPPTPPSRAVPADIPPPPGIDDPGVNPDHPAKAPQPAGAARAKGTAPPVSDSDPAAPLPKPDTRLVRDKASRAAAEPDAARMAASDVRERKESNGDTVDEYRENGRVWMIRVHPAKGGPARIYTDADGDGRLDPHPDYGPISPVYYTLYEWN